VKDPGIAPVFSGYAADDGTAWAPFRAEYLRSTAELNASFSEFCAEHGAAPLAEGEFIHESWYLNLYLYPEEIDYPRTEELAPTWHRIDTCVRSLVEPFEVPAELGEEGALVYLSLGSLGSADVDLMKRLVEVLGTSRHRYIVSKGPQHTEFDLAPNMWGGEYLPQPAILPHCDLVITHGGNNTTTEALHHGKPLVALPLFWDQHDNAQRVHETGVGRKLPTYGFEADELLGSVDDLLADDALRARLAALSQRVQAHPGRLRAADLIERLATSHEPVVRS
jgi:MGT family glycosyltransferase